MKPEKQAAHSFKSCLNKRWPNVALLLKCELGHRLWFFCSFFSSTNKLWLLLPTGREAFHMTSCSPARIPDLLQDDLRRNELLPILTQLDQDVAACMIMELQQQLTSCKLQYNSQDSGMNCTLNSEAFFFFLFPLIHTLSLYGVLLSAVYFWFKIKCNI